MLCCVFVGVFKVQFLLSAGVCDVFVQKMVVYVGNCHFSRSTISNMY